MNAPWRGHDYIPSKTRLEELEKRFPLNPKTKDKKKFLTFMDQIFDLDDPAMN